MPRNGCCVRAARCDEKSPPRWRRGHRRSSCGALGRKDAQHSLASDVYDLGPQRVEYKEHLFLLALTHSVLVERGHHIIATAMNSASLMFM